jgi:hypothetical protein
MEVDLSPAPAGFHLASAKVVDQYNLFHAALTPDAYCPLPLVIAGIRVNHCDPAEDLACGDYIFDGSAPFSHKNNHTRLTSA